MNKLNTILLVILIAVVGFFGFFYFSNQDKAQQEDIYQAVFLNTGQVYFGKLSREASQYPVLKDVYYLQIDEDISRIQAEEVSRIRLIKLGGELHGPVDEMKINRQYITFIEDLRPDSNVVEAIKQHKSGTQQ